MLVVDLSVNNQLDSVFARTMLLEDNVTNAKTDSMIWQVEWGVKNVTVTLSDL